MDGEGDWIDPVFGDRHLGLSPRLRSRLDELYLGRTAGSTRDRVYEIANALSAVNSLRERDQADPFLGTAIRLGRARGCSVSDLSLAACLDAETIELILAPDDSR